MRRLRKNDKDGTFLALVPPIEGGIGVNIALTQNGLLVTLDHELLHSLFVQEFINNHSFNRLILPASIILFHSETLLLSKQRFLKTLAEVYAKRYNFSKNFFVNALLKLKARTIRLDLDLTCKRRVVDVDLFLREKDIVGIRCSHEQKWMMEYFSFLLEPYLLRKQGNLLFVRIEKQKAKHRVQKMVCKNNLFDCDMIYNYNDDFIQGLFQEAVPVRIYDVASETMKKMLACYSILDCPVGVSQAVIRQNYKKLAKAYHPDRVLYTQTKRVTHYTQKFQMLQEAYSTLKNFG